MKHPAKDGRRLLRSIAVPAAAGLALAMLVMAVSIYFGYCEAYESGVPELSVSLLGLEIFRIAGDGGRYAGTAVGPSMGLVCGVFIAAALCAARLAAQIKPKA